MTVTPAANTVLASAIQHNVVMEKFRAHFTPCFALISMSSALSAQTTWQRRISRLSPSSRRNRIRRFQRGNASSVVFSLESRFLDWAAGEAENLLLARIQTVNFFFRCSDNEVAKTPPARGMIGPILVTARRL